MSAEVLATVSGFHRPGPPPEKWAPAKRARALELQAIWSAHIPENLDAEVDDELFYEQAARLEAVLELVGPAGMWMPASMAPPTARNLATGEVRTFEELQGLRRVGGVYERERITTIPGMSNYAQSAVVRAHAARAMECTGGDEDTLAALERMRDLGIRHVLVKLTAGKHPLAPIDLSGNIRSQLLMQLGWDFERINPEAKAFIVQERALVEYEYRLFVVDGCVVTGAANIAAHTPLDNLRPVAFSPLVVRDRRMRLEVIDYSDVKWGDDVLPGDVEPLPQCVESRTDLVSAFVAAGQAIVDAIAEEGMLQRDYSLDLALINGRIGVVELNEFSNSGLYASDPKRMIAAFLAAPKVDWWRPLSARRLMEEVQGLEVSDEHTRIRLPT